MGEHLSTSVAKGSGKNLHNRFSCAKGTNIYVKVLCLVIVTVNVTKIYAAKMSNI